MYITSFERGCSMTFIWFYVGSKYPYFISYRGKWLYLFCHGCRWSRGCVLYTLRRFEKDKIVWFIHPFLLFLTLTNDSFFSFQRILQILRNCKFLCANSFTFEHLELEIYHTLWVKIKSATLNPGTLSTIHWWSYYTIHLIFRKIFFLTSFPKESRNKWYLIWKP